MSLTRWFLAVWLLCAWPPAIAGSGVASWAKDEPIQPIPPPPLLDPARVALGRRLFSDTALSRNRAVSCTSCHDLRAGGADARGRGIGFDGQVTPLNVPTVFNAALNFRQFWNGRAASLQAQVEEVVSSPTEMGGMWPDVVDRVSADPRYRRGFAGAYPDGVTRHNVADAIATFERTLLTPNSRFDRYLEGEASALSDEERRGYEAFKRFGCVSCHQGANVGGNMFQKFGVMRDYLRERGGESPSDLGRFQVTGQEADRQVFKVPSLRNLALTGPYFHDGSARTLGDAIDVMFKYQLGRTASLEDKASIILFLRTLTGERPASVSP